MRQKVGAAIGATAVAMLLVVTALAASQLSGGRGRVALGAEPGYTGSGEATVDVGKGVQRIRAMNLAEPTGMQEYIGWFVNSDSGEKLNTGELTRAGGKWRNNFNSPDDLTNHGFDRVVVTLEPGSNDTNTPAGPAVLVGAFSFGRFHTALAMDGSDAKGRATGDIGQGTQFVVTRRLPALDGDDVYIGWFVNPMTGEKLNTGEAVHVYGGLYVIAFDAGMDLTNHGFSLVVVTAEPGPNSTDTPAGSPVLMGDF